MIAVKKCSARHDLGTQQPDAAFIFQPCYCTSAAHIQALYLHPALQLVCTSKQGLAFGTGGSVDGAADHILYVFKPLLYLKLGILPAARCLIARQHAVMGRSGGRCCHRHAF